MAISGHQWPSVAARTHRELLINEIEVLHQLHPLDGRKDCRQLPIREVDTLCERICLEERLRRRDRASARQQRASEAVHQVGADKTAPE